MPESTLRFHYRNECTTLYAPTAFRHLGCPSPQGDPRESRVFPVGADATPPNFADKA